MYSFSSIADCLKLIIEYSQNVSSFSIVLYLFHSYCRTILEFCTSNFRRTRPGSSFATLSPWKQARRDGAPAVLGSKFFFKSWLLISLGHFSCELRCAFMSNRVPKRSQLGHLTLKSSGKRRSCCLLKSYAPNIASKLKPITSKDV